MSYELVTVEYDSVVLRGNPLGDPSRREILVLAPSQREPRLPVVYLLSGFGSRGRDLLGAGALETGLAERISRLVDHRSLPPAYFVLPDCSTRYGGSQYLDSPLCGPYQQYLVDEVVRAVDDRFQTVRAAAGRAIMGKSSGGYGAILAAVSKPGVFGHVIAHTPDAGFEHCYLSLLSPVMDTIVARGGIKALTTNYDGPVDAAFIVAMSLIAMGACYASEGTGDVADAFPCDPDTGQFRDQVWEQWLAHDPVRLVSDHVAALSGLGSLFLDAGQRDEYGMRWGVRALHATLKSAGVPHIFEEHEGGHHGIEHRFERSLGLLGRQWNVKFRCVE